MTGQHPLTDEIIEEITWFDPDADDMHAAADWQLEELTKWLKGNTANYVGAGCYFHTESFLDDLKKAMRPQQQQQEN